MLRYTDRHFRFLCRLLSRHTLLYTEMVTTGSLLHGNRRRFLAHSPQEHPLSLQLGGDDPGELAECARMAEDEGFQEVNLNVGCPSPRVQRGGFGAALMLDPPRTARCVEAMCGAVSIPVTVKHRIGVDEHDSYEELLGFARAMAGAGACRLTVHARKAWLEGLSPRENRTVPPLRYDVVVQLRQDLGGLPVELNGGVQGLDEALDHLERVDAVMIGRAAYENPYLLAEADRRVFGIATPTVTRQEALGLLLEYVERMAPEGVDPLTVLQHARGLFHGQPGARTWRQLVSEPSLKRASPASLAERLAPFTG